VVACSSIEEPLGGAGRLDAYTGGGEGGVEGLVVPGGAVEGLRRRRRLMKSRHGLMRLEWWPWPKNAGTGGPQRHVPGLDKPSPGVIAGGPRGRSSGVLLRLTTTTPAATGSAAAAGAIAPALLLGLGPVGGGAPGAAARAGGCASRAARGGGAARAPGGGARLPRSVRLRSISRGVVGFRSLLEEQVRHRTPEGVGWGFGLDDRL
jgi:hypothetical protein